MHLVVRATCVLIFVLTASTTEDERIIIKLSPEKTIEISDVIAKCLLETNYKPDALYQIIEGRYVETETSKKFIYCGYKTAGYIHENGRVKVNKVMAMFGNDSELRSTVEMCDKDTGNGPEENINAYFRCMLDNSPVKVAFQL